MLVGCLGNGLSINGSVTFLSGSLARVWDVSLCFSEAHSRDSSIRNAGVGGCAVKSGQVRKATPERAAGICVHLPDLKRGSGNGAAARCRKL